MFTYIINHAAETNIKQKAANNPSKEKKRKKPDFFTQFGYNKSLPAIWVIVTINAPLVLIIEHCTDKVIKNLRSIE